LPIILGSEAHSPLLCCQPKSKKVLASKASII
jgi:hypothetical protein